MKHTPGPWTLAKGSLGVYVMVGDREISSTVGSSREDLANARLIAAAPELLAALENLVDLLAGDQWSEAEIDVAFNLTGLGARVNQARAAIAKARGEV